MRQTINTKLLLLSLLLLSSNLFQLKANGLLSPNANEDYLEILAELTDHIEGTNVLSDEELAARHDIILANIDVLAQDTEAVAKSFDLIELFEGEVGALFTTSNTRNGFNKAYASDGRNLHRNMILIHQGLIDHAYNKNMLLNHAELFEGRFFQSSNYFPGAVEPAQDSDHVESATIRCSYMLASGTQPWATIGNPNVVRPTGCYLAPGSISELTVPESMVGKGLKVRVGAHFWDLSGKGNYKRMDRVSITFDIDSVVTTIAHPLGGGIYIEIPLGIDEGLQDIALKNVVRSPFFSLKDFHETTLEEWQNTERHHPGPWTDFETDRFMMQVPTSWIYAFDDPLSLLKAWDDSMDAVSDLLGRPHVVDRHKNYLQFDVIIRGGAYHPGYPMSNTPYNPNDATDGMPKHKILQGPQFDQDIHFHELGHEVAISKFAGETEAIVNFLYVPVLNKNHGVSLDEAFMRSFGPSYNYYSSKDNSTRTRLVAESFKAGVPRNTCSCTKNEVRYQHRGYAHYVDIVELFGWEALERFWASEGEAADMGNAFPVNNQPQDDRIFRMSQAAGVDLRPLFHFWGIHPNDQDALAQRMSENNLALPMAIKEKLHDYRKLIPEDKEAFIAFANELYPDFQNYSGTQFDFGAGWYQLNAETYTEETAMQIEQALSYIIRLYYGTDCFEVDSFETAEFDLPESYCESIELIPLPRVSDNGISGTWDVPEIYTHTPGEYSLHFTPEPSACGFGYEYNFTIETGDVDIIADDFVCFGSTQIAGVEGEYNGFTWLLNNNLISESDTAVVNGSGVLFLEAFDTDGCVLVDTLTIVENYPVEVSIRTYDALCFGEYGSAEFDHMFGFDPNFEYSMEGDSLYAGTYTLVVTDEIGCSNSFDFVIDEPDPISIDLDEGQVVVVGGTAPYTISIDSVGGVQKVEVVDANGCEASAEFILTDVLDLWRSINIFPNPAGESIQIHISGGGPKVVGTQILGMDGRLLEKHSSGETNIDVSNLKEGIYLLHILLDDGRHVIKRVVLE